jgi:hypothetical protein
VEAVKVKVLLRVFFCEGSKVKDAKNRTIAIKVIGYFIGY